MKKSMYSTTGVPGLFAAGCLLPILLASPRPAQAQEAPRSAKASKPSFSNRTGVKAAVKLRGAKDEEMVEAVLADTTQRLYYLAGEHFHHGEYSHAININRVVAQGDPHNTDAYGDAGWLLWSLGRLDEAEEFLKEGLAANPNTYDMYEEMGTYWWMYRKNPANAIPFLEKAVQFDCRFNTWNSLATCYEKTNQWDKAVTAWEKASVFPANAAASHRLKQAREHVAQQKK